MSMMWKLVAVLSVAGLAGCFGLGNELPSPAESPSSGAVGVGGDPARPEFEGPFEALAENLRTPWAISFAGETIYISERDGSVVRLDANGTMTRKAVEVTKGVSASGESGFLGFVLAPDFAESRTAYAYHTYEERGRILNRIVLLEERKHAWTEVRALLEGIPGSRIHDGGRLAFGPDGLLYATTGDAGDEELAQDLSSLAGKILRMTPEGGVPEGNPFPESLVYSYGHRNPQGLAWGADGTMYAAEHGPSGSPGGHDEINEIEAGGNYGWPDVYGGEAKRGTIPPLFHSGEPPAIAPSGIAATEDGRLLLATLRGETLFRFDPAAPSRLTPILGTEGRLRDVTVRGGYAYVLTNNTDGRGRPGADDDRLLIVRLPE